MSMHTLVLIFKLSRSGGKKVSFLNQYLYGLFLKATKI